MTFQNNSLIECLELTKLFVKAYTCYILTAVVDIFLNREVSLFNVLIQNVYREMNGEAAIAESIKHNKIECLL